MDTSILKDFENPFGLKHGLPGVAYVSDEFLQYENRHLFGKHWVFVAFAHELPKPGDAMPIQVGGQPLFLVRSEAQEINAFHNICRHRNLQLIAETGNCGRLIRCPYHSWSYDLCGKLKNAPYFGGEAKQLPPDFELDDHGLMPVKCAVWHDWVFISLDADAPTFESFLQPILKQLGDNDVADYLPVATIEFGEVGANWKLLMENFIEPYHVQFVHRTTTSQPIQDHYPVIEGHCLGSAVDLSAEQVASATEGTLGVTSQYLTLFPNFVLGTYQPDQLGVHLNIPLSAEVTLQRRVIYVHKDSDYSEQQIQQLSDLWHSVHLEDHAMCERLQTGRHSDLAEQGGILSPHWETSVRKFQELVAAAVRPGLHG
ncbi:MAG: SRPBCC family protein [Gammaproteobacteria bacterium]